METLFPTIVTTRKRIPATLPLAQDDTLPYRIAIVADCPDDTDENHNRTLVGRPGAFLTGILRDVKIDRNLCYLSYLCNVRCPGDNVNAVAIDVLEESKARLRQELNEFKPNIVVLVGAAPLQNAKGSNAYKIASWRGSLFTCSNLSSPFYGFKCIATLHPRDIFIDFAGYPLLKFDLNRARNEASFPTLTVPQRELLTGLTCQEIIWMLESWPAGQRCSLDIEGGLPEWCANAGVKADAKKRRHLGWRCIAFSARPTKAFVIAWWKFSESEHARLLHAVAKFLARTDVPKVLQNGLYDNFVLTYGYGMLVRNVTEETMLKSWEIYAELPRSLSVQASIWTREPHWKDDEMYESTGEALALGCCKDVAVTLEICQAQDGVLPQGSTSLIHYRKMVEMLNPFLYMELRGVRYDTENVARRLAVKEKELADCAARLIASAGRDFRGKKGSLSTKQLTEVLYSVKGFPPQYKKVNGRKTDKLTTDNEALLNLNKLKPDDPFLADVLKHRHLEGVRETLNISADPDGRVRCGYSLEAETGRVKCYTSPTGAGANLQTIQKDLRDSYCADPNYDFFQCDLEGADGWTVAAHCARLGDPTMLDDYRAGMKPAKIIALLYYFGVNINQLDRESLKFCHDKLFPVVQKLVGKWLYMGCKRVQHGSNYLMGIPTMQLNVLRDSYKESGKPIYLLGDDARTLQNNYFARYPGVQLWHRWAESKLIADGKLTAASGHTRIFFGRRFGSDIKTTVKEFLAHEPQNNTTWATNLAMLQLWNDMDNRIREVGRWHVTTCAGTELYWPGPIDTLRKLRPGGLIIEPLHQVHDALNGQWPTCLRDWSRAKVKTYFNNPLVIAGQNITIPFDGAYGPNWKDCYNKL